MGSETEPRTLAFAGRMNSPEQGLCSSIGPQSTLSPQRSLNSTSAWSDPQGDIWAGGRTSLVCLDELWGTVESFHLMVLRLGCGSIAKERFEAGLSRVIVPALLPWGAGDGFGSSSCA